MQLVEQHSINRDDPRWASIDNAAWMSKNIYNAANYIMRQSYISGAGYLNYNAIEKRFKQRDLLPDQQLPLKVVQQVLKQVDHDGKSLKSVNQWYNKELARLKSALPLNQYSSRRIQALTHKRNCRVEAILHAASKRIIEFMRLMGLGTLVIGKNHGWKQNLALGKRTNQNFVQIPPCPLH